MMSIRKLFLYLALSITIIGCSSEKDGDQVKRSNTYSIGLFVEASDVPNPLRAQAKTQASEILMDRLKRVSSSFELLSNREGFDLQITTTLSPRELEFLLSTRGDLEMWEAIPGEEVVDQLHEAEDRLSYFMYPEEYDLISGIEYYPDSLFYELDSNYLSLTDTIDITEGMDKIQRSSLLYMAYPFTSRIRFGTPGRRAKVGKVRLSDRRDVVILFDKAFEYGLIHRDIAFYWGVDTDDDYCHLFAVDTSSKSNLGLKRNYLKHVNYSDNGALTFELNEVGETEMLEFSEVHLDRPLAVLLDDKVIGAPIMSKMISKGEFSVDVTLDKGLTQLLAYILDLPKMPVKVTVLRIDEVDQNR